MKTAVKSKLKRPKHSKALWVQIKEKSLKKTNNASSKRIRPVSLKRSKELRLYDKLRVRFLKENPVCSVFPEGGSNRSTQVHHRYGRRGDLLNWIDGWISVSQKGHEAIHKSPEWARRMGYLCPKGQFNTMPNHAKIKKKQIEQYESIYRMVSCLPS
jgi:hypothetical protein